LLKTLTAVIEELNIPKYRRKWYWSHY